MEKNLAFYKDAYEQEMDEIRSHSPNVKDVYYSPHRGMWIITFYTGNDEEWETKEEAIQRLVNESIED